ncbi:MAG TPA: biotin--[acetyl-CoA-carboxylase] ligase [Bacteroidales bacterium]|nr:biotin--[acetyl-CoA-carboxylase] ligase [Bacteroidales bacterium]
MIIGSQIIHFETLTSTNALALGMAASENPKNGTIISAGFQSAGKGQPGNKWESDKNKNLLFSIILYPKELDPANQFIFSMAVSLGLHDYLGKILELCSIKWPNDIYVKNDKIAGILIESSIMRDKIEYLITGIGLNINQEKFEYAPNPTSLKLQTGEEYNIDKVLSDLIKFIERRYSSVISNDYDLIREDYFRQLYRFGKWSQFKDAEGIFTGRIVSVDNDGALAVERKNGSMKKYYFKEVEYIL